MSDKIIGIIGPTGLVTDIVATFYDLIFTSEKIVATTIGWPGVNSLSKKKDTELQELPIDKILLNDKKNFEVHYSDIHKIKIKKPGLLIGAEINIITYSTNYRFYIKEKKAFDKHVNLVRSVLNDKLELI